MLKRKYETEMAESFVAHVREKLRPKAIQSFVERLCSQIQRPIEPSDEYSREWFRTIFNLRKNDPVFRLHINKEQLMKYLNLKYNPIMTEKIIEFLDINQDSVSYISFIEKLRAKLIGKSHREQLKFCFQLFDHDGNQYICPQDLDVFNR